MVKINIGVMTGLNEAFVIDEKTKERLVEKDLKSKELIKPLLKGRNIGRYYFEWDRNYLLYIPWHFPLKDSNITGASREAEKEFKRQYPAVYNHLLKFKDKLLNRVEVGDKYEWYALKRYAHNYYQEFEKPKLVWQRVSKKPVFMLDVANMYVLDSTFFITGDYELLKFLIVVLSSRLIEKFYLKNFSYNLGDGYLLSKQYIEKIPIRLPECIRPFKVLADYLLFLNATKEFRTQFKPQIEFFDKQIADPLVYELYFKEKFHQDCFYQEPKPLLLEAIKPHLKEIDYDSWAKLYWKLQIEGSLSKGELEKMRELEQGNLKTILGAYEGLSKDSRFLELVKLIKSHKWVKRIEK